LKGNLKVSIFRRWKFLTVGQANTRKRWPGTQTHMPILKKAA